MSDTAPDAHVRLTLHSQHTSAAVATLTGAKLHTARATFASAVACSEETAHPAERLRRKPPGPRGGVAGETHQVHSWCD